MTFPSRDPRDIDAFMVGEWIVEPGLSRISKHDHQQYLEPKIMAVLMYLAAHPDQVVSGDALITEVWNGRPMGDNPVYRCIAQLRKAFGDDSHDPKYIITVPKRGYRLIAPIRPAESEPVAGRSQETFSPANGRRYFPGLIFAVAALTVAVVVSARFFGNADYPAPGYDSGLSLAVMPFSVADSPDMVFTGNGIAEEISQQLAEAPALRVIANSSVASLDHENLDISQAARLLGANHFLFGTLDYEGGRFMVHGRLVNDRGEELWNDTFAARKSELFTLIEEVVQGVSSSLDIRLYPEWVSACGGTRNIDACRKYKLAWEHLSNGGNEYKAQAFRLFEEALELDPGFAAAYAGIARTYLQPGDDIPWPEAAGHAGTAVRRALELDDKHPEAHVAQAILAMNDSRGPCPPICRDLHGYEAAEQAARKALSLSARSPDAHNILSLALAGQGRLDESFSHLNIALAHDPLNPTFNYNVALHKAYQGNYAGAIEHVSEFMERHPNPPAFLHQALAFIEYLYGNFDKSLHALTLLAESPSSPTSDWLWTRNYQNLGMFDHVEELLEARRGAAYFDTLAALARKYSLAAQGRTEELDEVSRRLMAHAAERYGPVDEWPRPIHQRLGQIMFLAGRYDEAVTYLIRVHGPDGTDIDGPFPTTEFDSVHALGYGLKAIGDVERGDAVIAHSLALIGDREAQGYEGLPDLTAAKARAYAIQGRSALAVATLRKAIAEGWRGYRSANIAHDPRWGSVSGEPDFEALLARVRQEVDDMQERIKIRLARLERAR